MSQLLFSVLSCSLWILATISPAHAAFDSENTHNPLIIKFKMEKTVFDLGERINGKVEVENDYPSSLPAIFHIKIFHDDKPFSDLSTSVAGVPFGTTTFTFGSLGIPAFNSGAD